MVPCQHFTKNSVSCALLWVRFGLLPGFMFATHFLIPNAECQSRTSSRFLCDTMHTLVESLSTFRVPCLNSDKNRSININHVKIHQHPSTLNTSLNISNFASATYKVQTLSPASSQIQRWRVHHLRCQHSGLPTCNDQQNFTVIHVPLGCWNGWDVFSIVYGWEVPVGMLGWLSTGWDVSVFVWPILHDKLPLPKFVV